MQISTALQVYGIGRTADERSPRAAVAEGSWIGWKTVAILAPDTSATGESSGAPR